MAFKKWMPVSDTALKGIGVRVYQKMFIMDIGH